MLEKVTAGFKSALSNIKKSVSVNCLDANAAVPPPVVPGTVPLHADTVTKSSEALPKISGEASVQKRPLLEMHFEEISQSIDDELEKNEPLFEKLQELVFKIVMLHMRKAAKVDQEYISELTNQIKVQAVQIQKTYNTWMGMSITVISATVSIGGGFAGISPLIPAINVDTARTLHAASQSIGTAGTGLQSLGSLSNNKSEGQRQILQIYLRRTQDKEEDRKGTKNSNNESRKTARAAHEEFNRNRHDVTRTILQ